MRFTIGLRVNLISKTRTPTKPPDKHKA